MSWPIFFAALAVVAFGLVFLCMGLNALEAAEKRSEQHEHVPGEWQ